MSLNTTLINAVREGQQATDRATVELDRVRRMYQMTDAGVKEQQNKLFSAAREVADAAKQKGLEAIEAAAAAIEQQENDESARRAADVNYLARLEQKLNLAKGMGEITQDDRPKLAALFSEFSGDALAVSVIRNTLGAERAFFFLPNDNTGARQKHLKGAVKSLFEKAMGAAGCDPAAFSAVADRRAAEINAFISYCQRQTLDFSRSDREVWQEIRDARPADGSAAAPRLKLQAPRS